MLVHACVLASLTICEVYYHQKFVFLGAIVNMSCNNAMLHLVKCTRVMSQLGTKERISSPHFTSENNAHQNCVYIHIVIWTPLTDGVIKHGVVRSSIINSTATSSDTIPVASSL